MERPRCAELPEQTEACLLAGPNFANPASFCTEYRPAFCARELAGGRISAAEEATCQEQAAAFCAGFAWTRGCEPSEAEARSCLDAMGSTPPTVPTAEIAACQFCGG
jgi:hypothetical protein